MIDLASITKQRIGKYTYLYESTSYRNEQGKPRNKKAKIGKIDPITNEIIFTKEYLSRNPDAIVTTPTSNPVPSEIYAYAEQFFDGVRAYGVFWFLFKITEKTGLLKVLQEAFPKMWQEIFTIACYLIVSDKPIMYCDDWLSENEWLKVGAMTSQRTSEIFAKLHENERHEFYKLWRNHMPDDEYLALDITSISSYSKQIADCEWGHNRDHEKLPQINLCMLYGETSRFPVYQTTYSGSLSDVTTLESTLLELRAIVGDKIIKIVADKGFYSSKNIKFLLKRNVHFLIAMSFNNNTAKSLVAAERDTIDHLENVIFTSGAPVRGITLKISWPGCDGEIYAHVYFDPEKAMKDRNELYGYVAKLKELAMDEPTKAKYKKEIDKYLIVEYEASGARNVTVKDKVVDKELETTGWLILLSDYLDNPQLAHETYRMKDVVEKGFWKYKNSLGLDRLRVHSDKRVANKTFIAFVALAIASHIHNVMRANDLYKTMTFDKLFIILAKLKTTTISGHRILRPTTKQQRNIFELFKIPLPVG